MAVPEFIPCRDLLSDPAASPRQTLPAHQDGSAPLLLAIPDICVYSTTHNRVVFPGRAPSLPFSCCLPCVHFFIHVYLFIYFLFSPKESLDAAIFSTLPMCWRQFMLWDTWQRLQKYFLLVLGEASLGKTHYSASKSPFPTHSPAHAVLRACF